MNDKSCYKDYTLQEIDDCLRNIVAQELGVDRNSVDMSSSLVTDLGADSLDEIEVIMGIEQEFDICITEEDANNANSKISLLRDLIVRKLAERYKGV